MTITMMKKKYEVSIDKAGNTWNIESLTAKSTESNNDIIIKGFKKINGFQEQKKKILQ